jgi:hypothetical protein
MITHSTTPPHAGVLQVESSKLIEAPFQKVVAIYRDFNNWDQLFPLTIRGAKLVSQIDNQQTVEVDHKQEGKVINILTFLSRQEIRLEEFKKKYDAIFVNRFSQVPGGTCYAVTGFISFKGIYRLIRPFLRGIVKSRINRFILTPMKNYAEG